jgi:thymidylate kinase
VLIDRYYYDFFVDQRRYRLDVPPVLVRLGHFFLKKPDLVVLLDAPSAVLQSRKQEVAPAETERQRLAYRELVRGLSNGLVLDATRPPDKVGAAINRAILDFMAQRTIKRWNIRN